MGFRVLDCLNDFFKLDEALKIKDALCAQIDLLNGAKSKSFGDIRLQCGAFTISSNSTSIFFAYCLLHLIPTTFYLFIADFIFVLEEGLKVVLSAVEIQLIFWANERDAPRIIGSHGITKKRIQECSKCKVLVILHTRSFSIIC